MIEFTWNPVDGRTIEYYRDKAHVIVIGLFEQGALFNWAILWGPKSMAGRFPKRRTPNDGEVKSRIDCPYCRASDVGSHHICPQTPFQSDTAMKQS